MATLNKTNADYDSTSDSLSIQIAGRKSSFSIENGDIVIDFDAKNEVVGLEFLNASNTLSIIAKTPVSIESLQHIKSCTLAPTRTKNTLVIGFTIVLQKGVIETSITVPLVSQQKLAVIV